MLTLVSFLIFPAYGWCTDTEKEGGVSTEEAESANPDGFLQRLSVTNFGVFYGPALKRGTSYQPSPSGDPDPDRPVILKNYTALNYHFTDSVELAGTVFWNWQPVRGNRLFLQDPFVRLSNSSLVSSGGTNLYGDFRVHFGVTSESRDNDLLGGVQTFQVLSQNLSDSRFSLGTYASARYNLFGKHGSGNDVELYLAPNVAYQINPALTMNLVYEMNASHTFGDRPMNLDNAGTDFEPGLTWEVSPRLMLNPFINFYPGGSLSLKSTWFGMMVGWKLL